jgi:formylglycine-generating enzyme required for sulfatase activity
MGIKLTAVLAAAVMAAGLMASPMAEAATSRGVEVRLKASEAADAPVAETVQLYGASHALVIGIDKYTGGWPRLHNAVKDAEVVAAVLRSQGFQVTLKTDLKSLKLRQTLTEFFAIKGADPDARLFLWYAGHGHTIGGEGFLVPADAPAPNDPMFMVNALPMRDFGSLVRFAQSKHVLSIFDSCFSGTVFEARGVRITPTITRKTIKPVRQFITSGDAGQQVRDDGSFREYFVRAVRGEEKADYNNDGYVTGQELGLFLSERVNVLTQGAQTPKSGKLHDVRFNQGDFVFVLPDRARPSSRSTAPATTGIDRDALFWQSIQGSEKVSDFEAYLSQFPKGTFAALARSRIEDLKGRQVASLPPAAAPSLAPSKDQIRETQRLLATLGYDPGPADGIMGRGTRTAIERFQRQSGRSADVMVSDELLDSLRKARSRQAAVRPATTPTSPPRPVRPAVGVSHRPGAAFRDCAECPQMVVIPAGSFRMGDVTGGGGNNEKPVHAVNIGYKFAVGKFEVTFAQWDACVSAGGCNGYRPKDHGWGRGNRPVIYVNWKDAKEYVAWLSRRTGKRYRLLSEAEWEYMARGRSTSKYPWGNSIDSSKAKYGSSNGTVPVARYAANAFGVHDTVGNVWEWTEDCWHGSYAGAPTDGSSWTSGGNCRLRVLRGGSWINKPRYVRSAYRDRDGPDYRSLNSGFRVARTF